MKQIFTMVTAIILTTSLSAFAGGKDNPVNQRTSYEMNFKKLTVEDGIDVILVDSSDKSIEFEGSEKSIAKVDWKIKDGTLRISSKKGSLKGKVTIVISVNELAEIRLKDGATLRSDGQLESASLQIYLDGDAFISVRNNGNINVEKADDADLDVRRVVGNVKFG